MAGKEKGLSLHQLVELFIRAISSIVVSRYPSPSAKDIIEVSIRSSVNIRGHEIALREIQRITFDSPDTKSSRGGKKTVAVIYQGSDDYFYMDTGEMLYIWNGSEWV